MQKSKITDNFRSTSTEDLGSIPRFQEIMTENIINVIIAYLKKNFLAFKFQELRLAFLTY